MQPASNPRPYWHVDMKWISGIIFFLLLVSTLILYTLSTLTQRSVAIPVATHVLSTMFTRSSEEGGSEANDIAEIRQAMAEQGTDRFQPFPGQPIYITEEELDTIPAEQIRARIFGEIAERYYTLGIDQLASEQTSNQEERAEIERQAGLLRLISETTHVTLQKAFYTVATLSLIPFLALIFFSYRLGRLVSPGLLLCLVASPGALLLYLITHTVSSAPQGEGALAFLPPEVGKQVAATLLPGFATLSLTGLTLLVLAIILGIWGRWRQAHSPT